MFLKLLMTIAFYLSGVLSLSLFSPCKFDDSQCLHKATNVASSIFFSGNSELGVESSDPLFIEEIKGDLPDLKFKFINSTFTGGKNAYVTNMKTNEDFTKVHFDFNFPNVQLTGKYEINGKLLDLDVEGSGDFVFTAGKYVINVDSELDKGLREDGRTHVRIGNLKIKCTPEAPVTIDLKNVHNPQVSSGEMHNVLKEKWLEISQIFQKPIWEATLQKIFSNFNEYLKHTTFEDFIMN